MSQFIARCRGRMVEWDQDAVEYVGWTVLWSAVLPFVLYAMFLLLFMDRLPGVEDLSGSGELWLIGIGILATTVVRLIQLGNGATDSKARQLMLMAVLILFMLSIPPWAKVAVESRRTQIVGGVSVNAFTGNDALLALAGGANAIVAVLLGYATVKLAN